MARSTSGTLIAAERRFAVWARRRLIRWAKFHYRPLPWRGDMDLYRALVTEVLLQQTDAAKVVEVRRILLEAYPTAVGLARGKWEDVAEVVKPLGLWRQRTQRLLALADSLTTIKFSECSASELMQIPSIGPYAAAIVACAIWKQPEPAVDVNSARIVQRFFGVPVTRGEPRRNRAVHQYACEVVSSGPHSMTVNYALLDLGAALCRAKPRCDACPLRPRCRWRNGTSTASSTRPAPTPPAASLTLAPDVR